MPSPKRYGLWEVSGNLRRRLVSSCFILRSSGEATLGCWRCVCVQFATLRHKLVEKTNDAKAREAANNAEDAQDGERCERCERSERSETEPDSVFIFDTCFFILFALPVQLSSATVLLLIGGHNNSYTHTHTCTHTTNSSFTHLQSRSEESWARPGWPAFFAHIFFGFLLFGVCFCVSVFVSVDFVFFLRCALSAVAAAVFFRFVLFFLPNKKRIKKQSKINARQKQEKGDGIIKAKNLNARCRRRVLFNVKNLDVFTPTPPPPPSPSPSTPTSTQVSVCVPLIFNYVAYFRAAFLFCCPLVSAIILQWGRHCAVWPAGRAGQAVDGGRWRGSGGSQTAQEMGKLYEIKIKENKWQK